MSSDVQRPPAPRGGLGRKNALDVVRSMAVIGAAVAVVVLLVPRPEGRVERVVDAAEVAAVYQDVADFELGVPAVPDGWDATSARFRENGADEVPTWHIGYLTDDERYAAVEVASAATGRWVTEETSEGVEAEQLDVAGRSWQVFRSTDPARTSLVSEGDGLTTVVTGSASLDDLAALAESALAVQD